MYTTVDLVQIWADSIALTLSLANTFDSYLAGFSVGYKSAGFRVGYIEEEVCQFNTYLILLFYKKSHL